MATKKKMLQAAAGAAGGELLAIEDVFSTYLYTGNATAQTITNGIDLAGEGGLVWVKSRSNTSFHALVDTERGAFNTLSTNDTSGELSPSSVTSFNSDGFALGSSGDVNEGSWTYASWTFRKAPRFFDVVTWTGDGVLGRTVSHNLGSAPGFIVIKSTSRADAWYALHKDSNMLILNQLTAELSTAVTADYFGDGTNIVRPTDTSFMIGNDAGINGSGETYVAYLFAHDPLGPSGDGSDGLIACGSYTGNGADDGPTISLGWEPQWLLIKRSAGGTGEWILVDTMRGMTADGNVAFLEPNTSDAEVSNNYVRPTADGFKLTATGSVVNASGSTYIYIAIRRGPMRAPTSATEVFALQQDDSGDGNAPAFRSGFPVDFALYRRVDTVGSNNIAARLTGTNLLDTDNSAIEGTNASFEWDYMNGWNSTVLQNANTISYMWKRAPGFMDVATYTGDGTAGRTVNHNLGVAPEMVWVKRRDVLGSHQVYHSGLDPTAPEDYAIRIDLNNAASAGQWNSTPPTTSNFTLSNTAPVNGSGGNFIAYLFATLPGISKVGSYTGNGTDGTVINCGFTSGARLVIIRRTDSTGSWLTWDSVRGIIAGNDPYIELDTTDVEVTNQDRIDPHSSGFSLTSNAIVNTSGGNYIFYAIA